MKTIGCSTFITVTVALCAMACNGRREVISSDVELSGEGRAASFVIVNLLDSEISDVVLDYGAGPVRFEKLRIESGDTVTRGAIAQLPRGGESLRVSYTIDGTTVRREVVVPTPRAAHLVPVAVLLPTRLPVEWHDPSADIFDLSRSLEEKYGGP